MHSSKLNEASVFSFLDLQYLILKIQKNWISEREKTEKVNSEWHCNLGTDWATSSWWEGSGWILFLYIFMKFVKIKIMFLTTSQWQCQQWCKNQPAAATSLDGEPSTQVLYLKGWQWLMVINQFSGANPSGWEFTFKSQTWYKFDTISSVSLLSAVCNSRWTDPWPADGCFSPNCSWGPVPAWVRSMHTKKIVDLIRNHTDKCWQGRN